MTPHPPQPGDTWQHPYGRMFKVLARNVMHENGSGKKWGPLATLQAKDDASIVTTVWQSELDGPAQREMLI
jgi:hypothetical protein